MRLPLVLFAGIATVALAFAAPLTLTVPTIVPAAPDTFNMGTARNPAGSTLTLDRHSLLLAGKRWTPVMGEFHYSRYPAVEWLQELRKMKSGGIDIVATYVFWIHHEEIEGQWEWSGNKDLRQFVKLAGEAGLKVIVRCGPWCHGEVRNGGLPDWIVARGKTRSEDPAFMASTQKLYHQIGDQLNGLLWKDGGPVIGIQLDNEYGGPAEYLLALKKIARAEGLDVPLYTRTGWPALKTPMPFGEIVPLYGVYAEGFWDRELTTMPGKYWAGFHFSTLRVDNNIANEALGRRDVRDADDVARYPYLTCEIGGGMMSSYHRRILVDPRDIEATTLVKLGSGSVSPGYYMYHGGTNPEGKLTTLMEEQATAITNWNDMPVKNYDFQAPLGQYGQKRPSYDLLWRLHYFLHLYGARLAGMDTVLPDLRPAGKDDTTTLRWAVRSDGSSGFLFVNNYERGRALPAKEGVQFALTLPDRSSMTFPEKPVTVPADSCFFWPFNLELGPGVTLQWATAQPIGEIRWDPMSIPIVQFVDTPGVIPTFYFGPEIEVELGNGPLDRAVADHIGGPGTFDRTNRQRPTATVTPRGDGKIVTLPPNASISVYNKQIGFESVLLVEVRSRSERDNQSKLNLSGKGAPISVTAELVHPAGPLRKIEPGKSKQPVAAAPVEADFANAAVWRIKLPADALRGDGLLRFHYTGDVARVSIGGKFITDDYYNGEPLEFGLRRHAAELAEGELTIAILPLQKDAPIYLPESARPDFGNREAIADLRAVDIVPLQ
jgi:beta-galactosidase